MLKAEGRLRKLEQRRPQKTEDERLSEIVRSLTLDEARFCLWVICCREGNWEEADEENPTDHPKPTKDDDKRFAQLLKPPRLKDKR